MNEFCKNNSYKKKERKCDLKYNNIIVYIIYLLHGNSTVHVSKLTQN